MTKIVSRFLHCFPSDQPAFETWLSDMAAKGLHVCEIGRYMARFEKGAPTPGVRFRLDPSPNGYLPDLDARADYRDMGWTYVCDTPFTEYYVFRADDPAAPELHTDPATQALTLRRLIRRRLIGLAICTAIVLAAFLGIVYACRSTDAPFYTFASEYANVCVLFLILFLLLFLEMRFLPSSDGLIALLCRRRALENGEPEEHRTVRRRHPAAGLLAIAAFVLIWGGGLVHDLFIPEYYPITDTAGLPYLDLGTLEGEPDYEPIDFRHFNSYEKHPTVLLPEHTEVQQHGTVPSRTWAAPLEDHADQGYSPQMTVLRCTAWTEGMAARIFDGWRNDSYAEQVCGTAYAPLEAACDRAAIVRYPFPGGGKPYTGLLLQDGKRVLRVHYWGEADLTEHLDEFTALLA